MLIASATSTDIAGLVRLVNRAYRGTAAAQGWTHEAALLDGQRVDAAMLAEDLARGVTVLMLRDTETRSADPLACVALERTATPGLWSLGMLSVDPAMQSRGFGDQMLAAGERHVGEAGGERLGISVIHTRDTLLAWYRRRGFVPTGGTAPFPYGDARFGMPLRPDLHFILLEKRLGVAPSGAR